MRNAVSLFEQLISDQKISYDHIVETLGVASEDEKKQFIAKLVARDSSLLDDFDLLQKSGKNLKNFFKEILSDIQRDAIMDLKNENNISYAIALLDTIADMLMKSKNSFDEVITFRIGLLKIVSSYTPEAVGSSSAAHASVVKTPMKQAQPTVKKEEDILTKAQDIFSSSPSDDISPTFDAPAGSANIDINSLVAACKKNG